MMEGPVTSGSTSEKNILLCAVRLALLIHHLHPSFFYTHERRVDGSALNNMHDFGHNTSGYARSYLLSFGSARFCPPCTRYVHFCTRFCPNGVAAYSRKSLLGTFPHMKTLMLDFVQETSGCTRFCPSPK